MNSENMECHKNSVFARTSVDLMPSHGIQTLMIILFCNPCTDFNLEVEILLVPINMSAIVRRPFFPHNLT